MGFFLSTTSKDFVYYHKGGKKIAESIHVLKERFAQKCQFSHYLLNPLANGKSCQVLSSTKHFWSFNSEQCCIVHLNNQKNK